jgi:polyhydroxyalkanoate synthesis regulator phasin
MGLEPTDKKYIFVYIRPLTEDKEPNEFSTCQDALEAARTTWAFVKVDFDAQNVYQKAWGVKSAPAVIGCDLFANDFVKAGSVSVDAIRSVVRNTPDLVIKYETKLKADFTKATDLVKTDEEKGMKLLVDICLTGKNGYKEVTEAQTKLNELTDSLFKKGELASAVSPEAGTEYFDELVKLYRTTAPGARAEVFLAVLDHARGNIQPAIQRLIKVTKYDPRLLKTEVESANKALDEISKAGDAKIEAALAGPDKALAKESVRKLARDYAGTDAGKHATEASK